MSTYRIPLLFWIGIVILFASCSKNINKDKEQKKILNVASDINFGQVSVNTDSVKLLLITNAGNTTIVVTDVDCPQGFTTDWTHGKIYAGETQTIGIKFSPTVAKTYSGRITVESDATSGNDNVKVKGEGIISAWPVLDIDRTSIAFGEVDLGITVSDKFVIKNTGTAPLIITTILTSDPTIFNGSYKGPNTSVPPGDSETVTVNFTPSNEQNYAGTYTVNTNAGTKTITATGKGIVSPYNIYAAGYEIFDGHQYATYWKNGNPVHLPNGGEVAKSIFIFGNDVYTAGSISDKYDNASAYYWKNSSRITLVNGNLGAYSGYGVANSIAVDDGGNVYVAGYKADYALLTPYATYWKNGTSPIVLTKESEGVGVAYGITIYNGVPYTCGRAGYFAKYWVGGYGGYAYSLTNGNNAAQATSIAVSNSTVYTAGYEENSAGKKVARYWKNLTSYSLTDGTRDAEANSIFVDGNDVYVAGYEINSEGIAVAKYWKNGTEITLGNGSQGSIAWSITVIDGNVFVGGQQYSGISIKVDAVYWKNGGRPVNLTSNSSGGSIRAITVKRR